MSRLLHPAEVDRQLEDLPNWRCTAGALRVRYDTGGFPAAVALLDAIAEVAEEVDHHPDLDLRYAWLAVATWTHTTGGVTQRDVELAHRISALAAQAGATPHPPLGRVRLLLDAPDPAALLPFWRDALGLTEPRAGQPTEPAGGDGVVLQDPTGALPSVSLRRAPGERAAGCRVQLHLPADAAARRVRAVVAAGGRLVEETGPPPRWLLADQAGHELVVLGEGTP